MFKQGSYQEYRTYLFDLKRKNALISNMYDVLLEKGRYDVLCNDAEFFLTETMTFTSRPCNRISLSAQSCS